MGTLEDPRLPPPHVAASAVAAMAALGVRSGSLPFARPIRSRCKGRFRRTDAHGCERRPAFAMQKVVGSSPIIRFKKAPLGGVFCCRCGNEVSGCKRFCKRFAKGGRAIRLDGA
jgi:hypothetical protein